MECVRMVWDVLHYLQTCELAADSNKLGGDAGGVHASRLFFLQGDIMEGILLRFLGERHCRFNCYIYLFFHYLSPTTFAPLLFFA